MSKSPPSKSLVDSTMALLQQGMDRNSRLAVTSVPPVPPIKAPEMVTPPTAQTVAQSAPVAAPPPSTAPTRRPIRTSGFRVTPQDHERINRIINQALSMGERIFMSDAIRLALIAYDPRTLTSAHLTALQATNGRLRKRKPLQ